MNSLRKTIQVLLGCVTLSAVSLTLLPAPAQAATVEERHYKIPDGKGGYYTITVLVIVYDDGTETTICM